MGKPSPSGMTQIVHLPGHNPCNWPICTCTPPGPYVIIHASIWQWGPIPRSPVVNSPIRGRFWLVLHPRGDLIGGKLSPLGKVGMGLCSHDPYPITMKSPLGTWNVALGYKIGMFRYEKTLILLCSISPLASNRRSPQIPTPKRSPLLPKLLI
jgi:hypothetical protein